MITVKKRKDYNEFEREVLFLRGDVENRTGLNFFFEHVYHTFEIAKKEIEKHSNEYNTWFENQDFETRQSIYLYDAGHSINSNPLTDTLYKSHFITIHSEFENAWKEIIAIHNKYFFPREAVSLNDKILTAQIFNPNCLLDKVVMNNKILISYNYLRNKIVHQKAVIASQEYKTLMSCINNGYINYLNVKIYNGKAFFLIEDIQFIRDYHHRILQFISEIADASFIDRQNI